MEGVRSLSVLVAIVALSLGVIARDPIALWSDAWKALPVVAAGGPKEQVGERGELDELIAAVSGRARGPVLFLAPTRGDHLFRAFFAAYALFPKRVIYAVPEPNQSQTDSWVYSSLTKDDIDRLAAAAGSDCAIFWKVNVPAGFGAGRDMLEFSDQRSVVFLR